MKKRYAISITLSKQLKRAITILTSLAILLSLAVAAGAATRTTIKTGSFTDPTVWDCTCVPDTTDNILVATGDIVFLSNTVTTVVDVEIENGASIAIFFDALRIKGDLTLNGQLDGAVGIELLGSGTDISGTGFFTNTDTVIIRGNKTILAGTELSMVGGDLIIDGAYRVDNYGEISLGPATLSATNASATLNNRTDGIINVGSDGFLNKGILVANDTGNVINYYKIGNQTIKEPQSGEYWHLHTGANGIKSLPSDLTVYGDIQIDGSSQLSAGSYTISVHGDWNNNSSHTLPFDAGTGTVSFANTVGDQQDITCMNGEEVFYTIEYINTKGEIHLGADVKVTNMMIFNGGLIYTNAYTLSQDTACTLKGTISASSHVVVTSTGKYRHYPTSLNIGYIFPTGDGDELSYFIYWLYAGTTLSSGEYMEVNITDAIHPDVSPGTDHITKYYTLNSNGFSSINYSVQYYYKTSDIVGVESNMSGLWSNGYHLFELAPVFTASNAVYDTIGTVIPYNAQFTAGDPVNAPILDTVVSIKSGDWDDPNTWDCSCDPNDGDYAVISSGHTVELTKTEKIYILEAESGGILEGAGKDLTITAHLVLDGEITNVGDLDMTGDGKVITGAGSVSSTSKFIINGNYTIQNNADLTFTNSDIEIETGDTLSNDGELTMVGSEIKGKSASSCFKNASNSTLNTNDKILSTGVLIASESGNTVNYNDFGNQDIIRPLNGAYYNLVSSNSGDKKLKGEVEILGDLSILNATLLNSDNYDIYIYGDWINTSTDSDPFDEGSGEVIFSGSSTQSITITQAPEDFYDLKINKPMGDVELLGEIMINNTLDFDKGDIVLNASNLHFGGSSSISTAASDTSYVQADSSGVIQKEYTSDGVFMFPVGDDGEFTPITFQTNSGTNYGGSRDIQVRLVDEVSNGIDTNGVHITRYWFVNSSFVNLDYNISYIYDDFDVVGAENQLWAQYYDGTQMVQLDSVNPMTNTLSATGLSTSPSNWEFTGGSEINGAGTLTSVQSGAWTNPTTWDCMCTPDSIDNVIISVGDTVRLSTASSSITEVKIDTSARLEGQGLDLRILQKLEMVTAEIEDLGELEFAGSSVDMTGEGEIDDITTMEVNTTVDVVSGSNFTLNDIDILIRGSKIMNNYGELYMPGENDNIDGENSNSEFRNKAAGEIHISGEFFPNAGELNTSGANNIVNYYGEGDQTIILPNNGSYGELQLSGEGIKLLQSDLIVDNNLSLNDSARLDYSASNYILELKGDLNSSSTASDPVIERQGELDFNHNGQDQYFNVTGEEFDIYKFDHSTSKDVHINGDVMVTGELDFKNGMVQQDGGDITFGENAVSSGAMFNRYIEMNGEGEVIKEFGSTGAFDFPIGDGEYSNLNFTMNSFTGSGEEAIGVTVHDSIHPTISTGSDYLERFWIIDGKNILSIDYDIEAYYKDPNDVFGDEANIDAILWNGQWITGNPVNTISDYISISGDTTVPSSASFGGTGNGAILPVELIRFNAIQDNGTVDVVWATASEHNTSHFEVQRSADGKTYTTLGTIKAIGSSTNGFNYVYKDEMPLDGVSYYRLRIMDNDGAEEFSKEVAVTNIDAGGIIRMYPNPGKMGDNITLIVNDISALDIYQDVNLEVYAMDGRLRYSERIRPESNDSEIKFSPVTNINEGLYLFVIRQGDNLVHKERMLITK